MDKELVRKQLQETREDVQERLNKVERHIHYPEEPLDKDFAEQAVELENRDVLFELQREGKKELRLINNALDRLSRDEYHLCARCGDTIDPRRLQALPWVDTCIRCASAA